MEYDDVKELKIISDHIIRKTCTLKDISAMVADLEKISEDRKLPTRLNLEVGSHAIGLSISEIPGIVALLNDAKTRIESAIAQDNETILSVTNRYR